MQTTGYLVVWVLASYWNVRGSPTGQRASGCFTACTNMASTTWACSLPSPSIPLPAPRPSWLSRSASRCANTGIRLQCTLAEGGRHLIISSPRPLARNENFYCLGCWVLYDTFTLARGSSLGSRLNYPRSDKCCVHALIQLRIHIS